VKEQDMTILDEVTQVDLRNTMTVIEEYIAAAPAGATIEISNAIDEGHDQDHGDSQETSLRIAVNGIHLDQLAYNLPADPNDRTVYWAAFEAADDILTDWLRSHDVDCDSMPTDGTGWTVSFDRDAW
jgi:hypothetical protein